MNERIKKIREVFCDDNNTKFAEILGVKTQYASNITKPGKNVGKKQIKNILNKFPAVDPVWLNMGIGEPPVPISQTGDYNANVSGNVSGYNHRIGGYHADPALENNYLIEDNKRLSEQVAQLTDDNRKLVERINYLTDKLIDNHKN